MKIRCNCPECDCQNEIDVPRYVPLETPIVCLECQAEHATAEAPESTGM